MGGRCPRSPECCPRWIGITVRDQSESLSAIAGIRIGIKDFVVRAVPGIDMRLLFDVLRAVKAAA